MNTSQMTPSKNFFLINGRFVFDACSMKLTDSHHTQRSVYLSYKEGQLLHLILTNSNNKNDIIESLWGKHNVIVSDNSYYKIIHILRKKLLSIGLPKETLRTQSRMGLVCVLPVEQLENAMHIPDAVVIEPDTTITTAINSNNLPVNNDGLSFNKRYSYGIALAALIVVTNMIFLISFFMI